MTAGARLVEHDVRAQLLELVAPVMQPRQPQALRHAFSLVLVLQRPARWPQSLEEVRALFLELFNAARELQVQVNNIVNLLRCHGWPRSLQDSSPNVPGNVLVAEF